MDDDRCCHCGGGPEACSGPWCRYYVQVREWAAAVPFRRGLLEMSDLQSLAYRMRVAAETSVRSIERARRSVEGYQHNFLNRDLELSMKVAGARQLVADLNMIFSETSGGPRESPAVDVVGAGQPAPSKRDDSSSGVAVDLLPAAGPEEETGTSLPHEPTQRWLVEAIGRVLELRDAHGFPNAGLFHELQQELCKKGGG